MKILFIKQSSLGDLIHCFPALSDLQKNRPEITIDWLVDSAFVGVPKWHPAINESIPIPIRQWRKTIVKSLPLLRQFIKQIKIKNYDLIIDAQALIKSSLIAKLIGVQTIGFDRASIRKEKISTLFYKKTYSVSLKLHAIERVRQLLAQHFSYNYEAEQLDFSLKLPQLKDADIDFNFPYLVGIHGTTWSSKHLSEEKWLENIALIEKQGKVKPTKAVKIIFPWHSDEELIRIKKFKKAFPSTVIIANKMDLEKIAHLINRSIGVIAVDSGLAHISAALEKPTFTLFGSTNKKLTAALGKNAINIQSLYPCSPCMQEKCPLVEKKQYSTPPCYDQIPNDQIIKTLLK